MRPAPRCSGVRISRRDVLRVGGLGACGLALPQLLAGRALAAARGHEPRAKSCILLFMLGAPAHQDTWDLKPDAPSEIRGQFRPAPTSVPGIQVCEHVPHLARWAHRFALIRSLTHRDVNHSTSGYAMLTGRMHDRPTENLGPAAGDFPHVGSVLAKFGRHRGSLPPFVALPSSAHNDNGTRWPGQNAGFLGRQFDPFQIEADLTLSPFSIPGLSLGSDLTTQRLEERRRLLGLTDGAPAGVGATIAPHYERAFSLLMSPETRKAFDIDREPPSLRDQYLRNNFGQGCLMARRLVEAGVSLVTVYWNRAVKSAPQTPHWDTHVNNFPQLKDTLLPSVDRAVATLLEDLHVRGLLDESLVVWLSEFGRTPRVNPSGGRDHWGRCNSVWLAGASVRGGQVIGSSDRIASEPASNPISPADLAATVYYCLGLDPALEMLDPLGRPLPIATGRVITELFG